MAFFKSGIKAIFRKNAIFFMIACQTRPNFLFLIFHFSFFIFSFFHFFFFSFSCVAATVLKFGPEFVRSSDGLRAKTAFHT